MSSADQHPSMGRSDIPYQLATDLESLFSASYMIDSNMPVDPAAMFIMNLTIDHVNGIERLRIHNWASKDVVKIFRSIGDHSEFAGSAQYPDETGDRPLLYRVSAKSMDAQPFRFTGRDGQQISSANRMHFEIFGDGITAYWRDADNPDNIIYVNGIENEAHRQVLESRLRPTLPLDEILKLADAALMHAVEFPGPETAL